MSDDLLAELASLKDAPTPAPTTTKPTIDFSDPKYGGEIPNFQSYWKLMADHLQPMDGFKPFKSTKSDEEYVLCVMPWKHGKYITNIPIDVTKDQNGKYVTFQKKELKKGEVEKIKTHLLTHFEKCMTNGTLPVDLAYFVKVNNYIDNVKGMMVYRADLINVI